MTRLLPSGVVVFVAIVILAASVLATQVASTDAQYWPAVVALINLAAFIATCGTLVLNLRAQWTLKSTDMRMSFQKRYEDIEYDFKAKANAAPDAQQRLEFARVYYQRYWGLQMDQFEAWLEGLIPDRTYRYWMTLRRGAHLQGTRPGAGASAVGGVPYADGRRAAIASLGDGEFEKFFESFMQRVFSSPLDDALLYARRAGPRAGGEMGLPGAVMTVQAAVLLAYGLPYLLFPAETTRWTQQAPLAEYYFLRAFGIAFVALALLEMGIASDLQRYRALAWIYALVPALYCVTLVAQMLVTGFNGALWFWWINIATTGTFAVLVTAALWRADRWVRAGPP